MYGYKNSPDNKKIDSNSHHFFPPFEKQLSKSNTIHEKQNDM